MYDYEAKVSVIIVNWSKFLLKNVKSYIYVFLLVKGSLPFFNKLIP